MSEASPSPSGTVVEVDATSLSPSDFDPSLSEDERRFYAKAYPSIDLVRERKVHCTTCKVHIGTAPAHENSIKMHPILRVTHCTKCHDFYNSGEFSKGEDGSELYCRWCGQGGEVYCCSNCPFVFCKSCIVKNLSRGVVADIEQNENWSCFNCAPKILWPLRAQHWALIKYIDKQKKEITAMNLPEAEAKQEMLKDRSMCCRLAKAKLGSMSDSMESIDSLSRRSLSGMSPGSAGKKVHKLAPRSHSPAAKRPKTSNDEVVCTPDLLSMLEPDCQITVSAKPRPSQSPVASSPKVMSIQNPASYGNSSMQCSTPKNTPPPLVLRNTSVQMRPMQQSPIVRRTVVGPRMSTTGSAAPVYHTINGYRIDLNSAAQQETFRLPNGKLIQVKRQGSGNTPAPPSPQTQAQAQQSHNAWQRNLQLQQQSRPVQITPAHLNNQQQYSQITIQQHAPQQHPQMVRYQNTMVGNTTVTAVHNGSAAQIHVINGAPGGPTSQQQQQHSAQQQQPQPQAAPQQQARPLMVRHVFPDTAIGQARTQLQEQVFNAMEICQHLTGKVQTLTNSNAYKQARNYLEVKELYIHLSYLLTYAIGRFKGLQDKCLGDMRQLGFVNDADSLENGQLAADKQASDDEDNEIEIVEPKTDTITLDSDNDDDEPPASYIPNPSKAAIAPLTPATASTSIPNPVSEVDFLSTAQSFLASMLEVDLNEGDQNSAQASPSANSGDATQKKQPRKKTTHKPNPTLLKQKELLERERLEEMKRNDMKLKMKCTIELKKAEEEYPFAKDMLNESDEGTVGEDVNKKEDDNEEVELLLVEDMDSSLEDDKSKAEDNQVQEKTKVLKGNENLEEIKTVDKNLEKKEVIVSNTKTNDEESASKLEQSGELSKVELKDKTGNINKEETVTPMEVETEIPTKSQEIKDTESQGQKNETAEDNDIAMPKILPIGSSEEKESDDINNSPETNEILDSNISKEKESDDNITSETKALNDVDMSETKESDNINATEIKDSDQLNTSESKEIEMIEVPEEEEDEEIEKSDKELGDVESNTETNKSEKDGDSTELLAAGNANSDLADVTPSSSSTALTNGDSESKEKLELMVQTLTSDKDENKASISAPNKDDVGEAGDLMDDISELIEDASNALT